VFGCRTLCRLRVRGWPILYPRRKRVGQLIYLVSRDFTSNKDDVIGGVSI
jgi:hypothetical protein